MPALFIHAIIPASEIIGFRELEDEAGGPVYTVPFQGLAAVVQPTSSRNTQHPFPERTSIQRHRRIVDVVGQTYPVLPVPCGTVLADEIQVQRLLHLGYDRMQRRLATLDAFVQMDVTALWPLDEVLSQISEELSAAPQPTDRAPLGRRVNEALEQRRTRTARTIEATLSDLAAATAVQACIDERIVTSMALLLDERRRPMLDETLTGLAARLDAPVTFRPSGPTPPYAFATVTVQTATAELVDAARAWLGLTPYATEATIEHTYRRRAASLHPDIATDPEAGARRDALRACYRLLLAADAQSARPGDPILLIDLPRLDLPEPAPTLSPPSYVPFIARDKT